MTNRINVTGLELKRVRRTILFIETEVKMMELSKHSRKKLETYYAELKEDEKRLEAILQDTGGYMKNTESEVVKDDTEEPTVLLP